MLRIKEPKQVNDNEEVIRWVYNFRFINKRFYNIEQFNPITSLSIISTGALDGISREKYFVFNAQQFIKVHFRKLSY